MLVLGACSCHGARITPRAASLHALARHRQDGCMGVGPKELAVPVDNSCCALGWCRRG